MFKKKVWLVESIHWVSAVFIWILLMSSCNCLLPLAEFIPHPDNISITTQEKANITCKQLTDQANCDGVGWMMDGEQITQLNGPFWQIIRPNDGYKESSIIISGESAPQQVKLQCVINGCDPSINKTIFVQEKPEKISYECVIFYSSFVCSYIKPSNIIAIDEIQLKYINELKVNNQSVEKTLNHQPHFNHSFSFNSNGFGVVLEVTPVVETNYNLMKFEGNTVAIPIMIFSASNNCSIKIVNKLYANMWTIQAVCHLDKELIPSSFTLLTVKQGDPINCFNTSNLSTNSSVLLMHGKAVLDDNNMIDLSYVHLKSDHLENVTFQFNLSAATISTYSVQKVNVQKAETSINDIDDDMCLQTCFQCEFAEGSIPHGCYIELLIDSMISENFTINENSQEKCILLSAKKRYI